MGGSVIKISLDARKKLDELKIVPSQPYREVIDALLFLLEVEHPNMTPEEFWRKMRELGFFEKNKNNGN